MTGRTCSCGGRRLVRRAGEVLTARTRSKVADGYRAMDERRAIKTLLTL